MGKAERGRHYRLKPWSRTPTTSRTCLRMVDALQAESRVIGKAVRHTFGQGWRRKVASGTRQPQVLADCESLSRLREAIMCDKLSVSRAEPDGRSQSSNKREVGVGRPRNGSSRLVVWSRWRSDARSSVCNRSFGSETHPREIQEGEWTRQTTAVLVFFDGSTIRS